MTRMRAFAIRFLRLVALCTAAAVVVGLGYAELAGKKVGETITGSLFVVGGVIFVGAAVTGGGGRGKRLDALADGLPPKMPFAWVLVGLSVMGIGVLTIVL